MLSTTGSRPGSLGLGRARLYFKAIGSQKFTGSVTAPLSITRKLFVINIEMNP
jgi:hypothetical protein